MPERSPSRRVAIVGCGYVGTALGTELAKQGHNVVATTTTHARVGELRSRRIRGEVVRVSEVGRLREVLQDRDVVYLTIAPKVRGADYENVYLAGARSLLDAVCETDVARIIYTSSTRVYEQNDGQSVDEDSPSKPSDDRGRVLLEAERELLSYEGGPAVSVVRLSGIYGPQRDPHARIRSLSGTTRDDGDVYVNMIHRDDIVSALAGLLLIEHRGVLNLSDDEPTTRRVFYDRVLEEAGLEPIRWSDVGAIAGGGRGKRVRSDRIKRMLGLVLEHPTH